MSNVYRFTGPPENWITGFQIKKWAVNGNNEGTWNKLQRGDIALFHSTATSKYTSKARSVIVGYGVIGASKWVKKDLWWADEVQTNHNNWPFVITLDEIYLFKDVPELDLETPVYEKDDVVLNREVQALVEAGVSTADLIARAKQINPTVHAFPFVGSASRVDPVYEDLLLKSVDSFYSLNGSSTENLEMSLAEDIDENLKGKDRQYVMKLAQNYVHDGVDYITMDGTYVIRRDNETQKGYVRRLENYTCQVCGFKCSYTRKNGKEGWIIDVDHIVDKAAGGTESLDNLWVLCPNCHRKKTRGVITIDPVTYQVFENGQARELRDAHLLVN